MQEMSLDGTLEHNIVLQKICEQSVKDATGRRKSFRISRQDIQKAVQEKINNNLDELFCSEPKKPLISSKVIKQKRTNKKLLNKIKK